MYGLIASGGSPLAPSARVDAGYGDIVAAVHRRTDTGARSAVAPCACGGECPKCNAKTHVARSASNGHGASPTAAIPDIVTSVLSSERGSPLSSDLRSEFEPRLGVSLADVRVHTDHHASASARAVEANAYASGTNVVFDHGRFAPATEAGHRLLAHELTHVAQFKRSGGTPAHGISAPSDPAEREAQAAEHGELHMPAHGGQALVHREPRPGAGSQKAAAPTPAHPATDVLVPSQGGVVGNEGRPVEPPRAPPPPVHQGDTIYRGIVIQGNPERTKYDLKRLCAAKGRQAIIDFVQAVKAEYAPRPGITLDRPFGRVMNPHDYEQQNRAMGALEPLANEVVAEIDRYVSEFKVHANSIATLTLDANEKQAKDEAAHYGITTRTITVPNSDCLAGECTHQAREHSMAPGSAGAKELQEVAKILLARRKEIDATRAKRDQYHHLRCLHGDCLDIYDPPYEGLNQELGEKVAAYSRLRDTLADKYPIIERNADLDSSSSDLGKIASKGPGPEMAGLLGEQIAETLSKIKQSREGLTNGDVNIWRLPKIIDLTRLAMQTDAEPWKKRVIDDTVADNQPGIWQAIALAVLNIVALLLAAPTGGISLAVAAGVNIAVAAYDVKKYIMEDALANSSFRAAQALSADKPSLFWLALEIVGAVADVGGAAAALSKSVQAFRTLAPLVEAAKIAEEGKDAEAMIRRTVAAAAELKGPKVAMRIEQEIRAARAAAGKAELVAAGATQKEIQGLERITAAGDKAVLGETKALNLGEMTGEQIQRELGLVKTQGTPVEAAEGYVEAYRLDNGHVWQRTPDGKWCRFSKGLCVIFGDRGGYHIETPPTTHLPVSNGNWEGKIGDSEWLSTDPRVNAVTNYEGIPYRKGYPDFGRWSRGEVGIRQTGDRVVDFAAADQRFAAQQSKLYSGTPNPWLHNGQPNAAAATRFRRAQGLTWHHHQDGYTMQLIPTDLHGTVPHSGGVSTL